ncbi:FecR family protein [Pedobacter antarcticus]|uniref:FecR family protein n=1 Tax=Pedobacter antarcticus TaxID=34086 RepID=UPI000887461A|nr:FecR domain-containing protein [Pedobacter antarcticus]SDL56159.1 FecR family protein [Pedobacter antarcticus]
MNRDNIEALIVRYLNKETSAEENLLVEKWLADNGNADPDWQKLDRTDKDQWLSDMLVEIKDTIKQNSPQVIPLASRKYLWYKIAGVAAVLIVSFSLYLGWPLLENQILSGSLASISIPEHQQKQITLADGTTVWLNAGAELRYPKVFNEDSREVYLSGEAYFDVQHDAAKPFLIHTGDVVTRVLGTAFNIKEDKKKHTLEVTVTRGKVSVADDGKLLSILTANQQISLDLLSRKAAEKTVDARSVIAWQENDMLFDDVTFAEAATQLEQHFHVKITFKNDKLKDCRFSGTALKGDKLDDILDVICGFNNSTWQKSSRNHIIINGEGCN